MPNRHYDCDYKSFPWERQGGPENWRQSNTTTAAIARRRRRGTRTRTNATKTTIIATTVTTEEKQLYTNNNNNSRKNNNNKRMSVQTLQGPSDSLLPPKNKTNIYHLGKHQFLETERDSSDRERLRTEIQ